jgi:hypothetical protein
LVQEDPPVGEAFPFSADLGTDKTLAGGMTLHGKKSLYLGPLLQYRGRDVLEMAGKLIMSMRTEAAFVLNQYVMIRAGAATFGDAAVVLPSGPEPHLPALVGLLLREGAGYLGDEIVKITPVRRKLEGFSLPLLVDSSDISLFPMLQRAPARRRRGHEYREAETPRYPVSPGELGAVTSDPAPIGWVVFPEFEPGAETRLEPFGGAQAVFRFAQAVLNMNVWRERALLLARDLLDSAAVSRLIVGDMGEAAKLMAASA